MDLGQLDRHVEAVAAARAAFPGMRVLLGMECEDVPEWRAWFADELVGRCGCAYLIGSCHYIDEYGHWSSSFAGLDEPRRLAAYVQGCITLIESGLYAFLAHPDLFGLSNQHWTRDCAAAARDICAAAAARRVPLELNANGVRKGCPWRPWGYPWRPFWEVAAQHGVQVVLSSDAHRPDDTLHGHAELDALRRELGLVEAELPFLVET
jgi:histidinol-phosphatase (PHP family)